MFLDVLGISQNRECVLANELQQLRETLINENQWHAVAANIKTNVLKRLLKLQFINLFLFFDIEFVINSLPIVQTNF